MSVGQSGLRSVETSVEGATPCSISARRNANTSARFFVPRFGMRRIRSSSSAMSSPWVWMPERRSTLTEAAERDVALSGVRALSEGFSGFGGGTEVVRRPPNASSSAARMATAEG
jgi:hypothetical protein